MLSPKVWLLGVPVLVGVFLWHPSPLLLVFALLAAPQAWQAWKFRRSAQGQSYYQVSAAKRWEWGAYYLVLVGYLALLSHEAHGLLAAHR